MKNMKNSPVNALQFPVVEPWPEPVSGKLLLDELAGLLNRFVILPPWAADTIALWVLHTYAFKKTKCGRQCAEDNVRKTKWLHRYRTRISVGVSNHTAVALPERLSSTSCSGTEKRNPVFCR